MRQNLFKSPWDGLFYIVLYIAIPFGQCFMYWITDNGLFWYSVLLMTASMAYDSYTRFNSGDSSVKKNKIWKIGLVSASLFIFSFVVVILRSGNSEVSNLLRYPYALLLIPCVYAAVDLFDAILLATER